MNRKVLISAGLGKDITFDLAMMEAGFNVIGIDPISESVEYVNKIVSNNTNYTLMKACLAKDNLGLFMYAPIKEGHISWSVISGKEHTKKLYPSITLDDLEENEIVGKARLKVLKMDIEGAEVDILDQIAHSNSVYGVCLAELDYISKQRYRKFLKRLSAIIITKKVLKCLHRKGYVIFATEGYNFSWIHESVLGSQIDFERHGFK
jgi:FkbM family methyltransferase